MDVPSFFYQAEVNYCAKATGNTKKERSLYPHFLKPEQEKLVAHYLKNQFKPMSAEEKL